jgi:transposase
LRLQEALFEMSAKVRRHLPQWRKQEKVEAHYADLCAELHLPADLYSVEFYMEEGQLNMNFRKNHYRIGRYVNRFGKNILITSNMEWTIDEIVRASLDRYMVENAFRQTKDDELVGMMPLRHWTDSKIRCHILTCVVALTCLRLIELKLKRGGIQQTAQAAMEHMHRLHSCLVWQPKKKKPVRLLEEPDAQQAGILKAFGQEIKKGVLQEAEV